LKGKDAGMARRKIRRVCTVVLLTGWLVLAWGMEKSLVATVSFPLAWAEDLTPWQQIKGKHFEIFYPAEKFRDKANAILRKAEGYYDSIGARIGYTRYNTFWTWAERVKIMVFPDQRTFARKTGQPDWSLGYSNPDSHLFQSRIIMTYLQEDHFGDAVLPHEIGHLILQDYIASANTLPVWFDEGVAQLEEKNKSEPARGLMQSLVKRNSHIPLETLCRLNIRKQQDPALIKIFYAQSLSVVEFLLKNYGQDAFGRLCHNLRDGKSFPAALTASYPNAIADLADLEGKWLRSLRE